MSYWRDTETLQEFDFAFQPDLDARKIRDLAALAFVENKGNVALLGPPGVGKTHRACALAVSAAQAALSRQEANMVFQLVSRRYQRGAMILTSNKAFSEWGQVLRDDVLATAILDRVLHHCDVVSSNGPSYRLKDRMVQTPQGGEAAMS